MKAESITAIMSTVIAAAALFVAIWSGFQTREHDELSVQPILNIHFQNSPESEYSGLMVSNVGLGPALIGEVVVEVDNKTMPDLGYGGLKTAISNMGIDNNWVVISKLGSGLVIPAGSEIPLIAVSKRLYDDRFHSLLMIKKRVRVTASYHSMYEHEKVTQYPSL